jgi:putative CocE/NonD family hydrolase
MKKYFILIIGFKMLFSVSFSQTDTIRAFTKKTVMIPMRDGVKLYAVIFSPVGAKQKLPVLLQRTPYGSDPGFADDSSFKISLFPNNLRSMLQEGYYFIKQDVRGKFKSEGNMEIHQPVIHLVKKNSIDESTDTWDTVDWLVKNLENNNGNVGIFGVSYPGWLALAGAVDPHPALKASSEQACMGDLFLGDDFHHNGAFRLSYGMEYTYEVEFDKTTDSDFPFPQYDLFEWYRKLGSLKHVNEKYFNGTIPTWNRFITHPNYDSFWQHNSTLQYVKTAEIPQLHVGGYYDQEDLNGPQLMYAQMEKADKDQFNHLVLGPWNHGQWTRNKADSLGKIGFGSNTAAWFQELQKKWFDYYLKGLGDGNFEEAYCFQTGSNQWKTYTKWPPQNSTIQKLYAAANGTCGFTKPAATNGFVAFTSDPAHPVPYRSLPIEPTYANGSRWNTWHVEDQRFLAGRPDVVNFTMDALNTDLVVTGKVVAHLQASTSGTDADWIVKLIDVYPDLVGNNLPMSGFQLPVAMEVFRGRFRKSFSNPSPLIPNKPEEFVIDLHDINHVFKKGHHLMIQVQSTWFPVIDRNPQKYVPNIFEADDSDFIKATHRIYVNSQYATYLELPVSQEIQML